KWKLYTDLFGEPESIDVINQTVPSVFGIIEEVLRNDMTMSLGRLLDPPGTKPRENMSIPRLIANLVTHCEPLLAAEAERQLEAIRRHCEKTLVWRNKRVGHNDLHTALQYHENPLPNITKPYVEQALTLIRNLMNYLESHFDESETAYEFVVQRGTGKDLIYFLKTLLDDREREHQRLLGK